MKKMIKNTIYFILKIFGGENFANRKFNPLTLFKFLIIQKIFRINSHVPWPVHWTSQIKSPEEIEKGTRNPGMGMGCYLDGRNGIIIGKNTWIGPRVSIISMNHNTENYHKYMNEKPIRIGDNCWIATNAVILPGVELGNHVVIAAGAIVTKSFKENDILIAGVPAKVVKKLGKYEEKEKL
jgi:acetyltransferase-like isoleucine patch superfamily enzyme